eukprot:SAG22_NODE_299_length_12768_cov_11.369426_2_plen_430_part_00
MAAAAAGSRADSAPPGQDAVGRIKISATIDDEGPLGITWGFSSATSAPRIKHISASGLAAKQQQLRPGLVLSTVNGTSVAELPRRDAMALAEAARRPLELSFSLPVREGWLWKLGGGTGAWRSEKKRWAVLEDNRLRWFKVERAKNAYQQEKGSASTINASLKVSSAGSGKRLYAFEMCERHDIHAVRPLVFYAGTPASRDAWMRDIAAHGAIATHFEVQAVSDEDLGHYAGAMRDQIAVQNRVDVAALKTHADTFIGKDAVEWLVNVGAAWNYKEAEQVCVRMERAKLLHHCEHEHGFQDDDDFYRFQVRARRHRIVPLLLCRAARARDRAPACVAAAPVLSRVLTTRVRCCMRACVVPDRREQVRARLQEPCEREAADGQPSQHDVSRRAHPRRLQLGTGRRQVRGPGRFGCCVRRAGAGGPEKLAV